MGARIDYPLAEAESTIFLVRKREPHLGRGYTGMSRGGVRTQFSACEVLADLILYGHSDLIDAHTLNLARFTEGRLIPKTAVLFGERRAGRLEHCECVGEVVE